MTWKNFIVLQIAVIGVTNTGNYLVNTQTQNTEKIQYNEEAERRRLKNQAKEFEYKMKIHELEETIKDLRRKE